jgi:C1A family cysteine protease
LFQWKYSCNAYNETCSNTTPQGTYTCFRPTEGGKKICGLTAPKSIGGVRVTIAPLSVWDPDDVNASIETVKTLLDSGMQITLGLMVNQAFKAADTNTGYISYDGSGQSNLGSHAVHVVSYIENEDLAKIVPGAPPGEAGPYAPKDDKGGYFIIRNSWGTCWGDGGYAYIPYRWLRPVFFVHSAEAHDPASLSDAP